MNGDESSAHEASSRLVHLNDRDDFEVAEGDPDIRGWDVRTADGRRVGKVEDLIVDTGLMKVRYIDATLDPTVNHTESDRHVLIPIGTARLDDDDDDVYLSTRIVDPEQLPSYERGPLTREFEVSLGGQLGRGNADAVPDNADAEFYRHELYDESRFFGSRRRGREGSAYISRAEGDTRNQF